MGMSSKSQPEAKWFYRLRRSRWGLSIVAAGGILTGLAASTDAINKLLVFTGIKPNALQLAREDERTRFSRDLIRAAWFRLFVTRRYVTTIQLGYGAVDQDHAWERYVAAVEEWNRDLMVNHPHTAAALWHGKA
jgi:hypothetical protein